MNALNLSLCHVGLVLLRTVWPSWIFISAAPHPLQLPLRHTRGRYPPDPGQELHEPRRSRELPMQRRATKRGEFRQAVRSGTPRMLQSSWHASTAAGTAKQLLFEVILHTTRGPILWSRCGLYCWSFWSLFALGTHSRQKLHLFVMGRKNPLPFLTKGEICRRGMQYLRYSILRN